MGQNNPEGAATLAVNYEFRDLDEKTIQSLMDLSALWVEENCSYGMVANTAADIHAPLCVAVEQEAIVGYIFGHYYMTEKKDLLH